MRTPCCHSTFYWDNYGWATCCKCNTRAEHPTMDHLEGDLFNKCECHNGPNTRYNLTQRIEH